MIFLESKSKKQVIYSTITILGLVFTIVWFTPILWIIVTSFKPTGEILTNPPQWIPSEFTSFHYDRVFLKPIAQWTFNSLYITIISTFLTIVLGATAGYAFARLQFFGSTVLFWVVLSSFMMPFEVFLIPLYRMMGALDLVGTRWSIILPSIASPFAVYLFRQFFLGIPRDLEDAAAVDGAGLWRRFIYIILPLSVPACTSVGILAFAENFNQYLWPLLMSSSDTVKTLPVGIAQFAPSTTMGSTEITDYYGMGAAAATLLAIPSMIVFLILQRFFISNTMTSGMKL